MRRQTVPEKNKVFFAITLFKIAENPAKSFFSHAALHKPCHSNRSFRFAAPGDHARSRNALPPSARTDERSFSFYAPCPYCMRTVGKAGLVKKAECYAVFRALFLTCSQVFCFHIRIASSSRSTALLNGFWQEKPNRFNRCQTLLSRYKTPVHDFIA